MGGGIIGGDPAGGIPIGGAIGSGVVAWTGVIRLPNDVVELGRCATTWPAAIPTIIAANTTRFAVILMPRLDGPTARRREQRDVYLSSGIDRRWYRS